MLDKILNFIADRLGVDYIIEQGINSDGWQYTKYANGKIEMSKTQGQMIFSNKAHTQEGNRYSYIFDVKKYMTKVTSAWASQQKSGMITQATINGTTKTAIEIFLLSQSDLGPTNTFENVDIYLTGRWKTGGY